MPVARRQFQSSRRASGRIYTPWLHEPGCRFWFEAGYGETRADAVVADPNDMSTGSWIHANLSAYTSTMITDTLDVAPVTHYLAQLITALVVGRPATLTIELKAETSSYAGVKLGNQIGYVDLATGAVTAGAGVTISSQALSDSWWRVAITVTTGNQYLVVYTSNSYGNVGYQGDGTRSIQVRNVQVTQQNVTSSVSRVGGMTITWSVRPTLISADSTWSNKPTLDLGDGNGTIEAWGTTDVMTWPQPALILWVGQQASAVRNKALCCAPAAPSYNPYSINPYGASASQASSGNASITQPYTGYNGAAHRVEGAMFSGSGSAYYLNSTTGTTGDTGTVGMTAASLYFGVYSDGLSYLMGGKMLVFCGFSTADGLAASRLIQWLARRYGIAVS
jgi:hypothetical protein